MRAIIIGCGLIGIRRAEIIKNLGVEIFAFIDTNLDSAKV